MWTFLSRGMHTNLKHLSMKISITLPQVLPLEHINALETNIIPLFVYFLIVYKKQHIALTEDDMFLLQNIIKVMQFCDNCIITSFQQENQEKQQKSSVPSGFKIFCI